MELVANVSSPSTWHDLHSNRVRTITIKTAASILHSLTRLFFNTAIIINNCSINDKINVIVFVQT